MKYQITFADPNNIADQRVIDVSLTDDERETASAQDLPELHAQCYALRHAYKQAPKGWQHLRGEIRPVHPN